MVAFSTKPTVMFGNPAPHSFSLWPRGGLHEGGIGEDRRAYDLSPDGKRILGTIAAQTTQQALAPTIQVVLNWGEELKTRVP